MIDPNDIESRLQNWGRVYRTRPTQGVSMTGLLCDRLRINAVKSTAPRILRASNPYDEGAPDVKDAEAINKAWQQLSQLLKAFATKAYVNKKHPNRICSELSLRNRDFDITLDFLKQSIRQILNKK